MMFFTALNFYLRERKREQKKLKDEMDGALFAIVNEMETAKRAIIKL